MASAFEQAEFNHHILGKWEAFLGGAVRIATCTVCHRHAWAEVLPNGDNESGNQVYKTDIRGSAATMECSSRKVS